LKIVIFINPAS